MLEQRVKSKAIYSSLLLPLPISYHRPERAIGTLGSSPMLLTVCLYTEEAQVRASTRGHTKVTGLKETCSQIQTHSPRTASDTLSWSPLLPSLCPVPCAEEMG